MIYVTGDMHGEQERFSQKALRRLKKDDILIVCGDFGFLWENSPKETAFLKKLEKKPYTVAFLDGKHENFDWLDTFPTVEWNGGKAQKINDRCFHLLRGELYTVEEKKCFVFGGGESSDAEFRIPGKSWWQREIPSPEEMENGLKHLEDCQYTVDYVFTHVPPLSSANRLNPGLTTDGVSLYLNGIDSNIHCQRWYFGSLHKDKRISAQRQAVFEAVLPVE